MERSSPNHVAVVGALLLFTVALGAALVATRTARGPSEGRIELTLAVGYNVQWMRPFQELCDAFGGDHPEVRATVVGIPGRYYEKVLVMMAGRTAPDVLWMGKGFAEFASRGAFLDVEEEPALDPGACYERVVDCYRFDGRLKGFPYAGDFTVIVINLDAFEEAGLEPPGDDWTLEQFRGLAARLTRRDETGRVSRWGFRGRLDPGAWGAFLLSDDMTRHRVGEPAWLEYLRFMLALRYEDRAMPAQGQVQHGGMLTDREAFLRGEVAMISESSYHLPTFRQTIRDFRWDIAPMPRGARRSCQASTQGFAVWRHTPHPRQAVALLAFLTSAEAQRRFAELGVPAHRATATRCVQEMPQPPAHRQVLLQCMEFLNPAPRHPRLNELQQALQESENLAMERRETPERALLHCGRQFDRILGHIPALGR